MIRATNVLAKRPCACSNACMCARTDDVERSNFLQPTTIHAFLINLYDATVQKAQKASKESLV
jgi:hypothetical protein